MGLTDYLASSVVSTTNVTGQNNLPKGSNYAIVDSVVTSLDSIDDKLSDLDKLFNEIDPNTGYSDKNAFLYGAIKFRYANQQNLSTEQLDYALPIDRTHLTIPGRGELVEITMIEKVFYYKLLNISATPAYSTQINILAASQNLSGKNKSTNQMGIASMKEAIDSSIPHSGVNVNNPNNLLGTYYKRNVNIHQLKPNEGDTIIQSKFGSSIRFSGYLDDNKSIQSPAILIRNGENTDSQKNNKVYDATIEDVNKDGTSIQITSGKYKSLFSETVKVSKQANQHYPSSDQLIGDQLVVNSGRVIVSSKTAEIFLFSKKTFSIFTDDLVTIDSEKGLNFISQNGNIVIGANNNKNVIFNVGSGGKIYHGTDTATQQAVLGNELVSILTELITAINAMTIATPSGPSAPGPIDKSQFTNIQNKLKNILSKNNYLV